MDIKKLKYNKCPNCKEHTIPAFRKFGHGLNPIHKCPNCQKKYHVNNILSYFIKVSDPIIIAIVGINLHFPHWLMYLLVIIMFFVCEYYAPLEEIND